MHQFQGFPDLRLNTHSRESETTLWPSFTDIMTVILMVFMLTMVVVILKNAHLIERVRLSESLLDRSAERLAASEDEIAGLRFLNTDLEDKLRTKEMEIILLGDEAARLEAGLETKLAIIDRLTAEQQELQENIRILRLDLADRDDEIEAARQRLALAAEEHEDRIEDLNRQLAALLSQLDEKDAVLLTLSDQKSDLELALARQRQDFSSLEEQYLRLIRPARSAMGKLVATVQYSRVGGEYQIAFKDIGESEAQAVTLSELHRRLGALKEQYAEDLYVKIVIPDDSGLSYNEAWDFTKAILSGYDYYYIDGWPGDVEEE